MWAQTMNKLAYALMEDARWDNAARGLEKVAIDQHLRNLGAEIARTGGDVLSMYSKAPMIASTATGALVGGAVNAARADEDESRLKRFARGAGGGAVAGLGTSLLAGGAVRNLGRMGERLSDNMAHIRGVGSPGRNVKVDAVGRGVHDALTAQSRAGLYGRDVTHHQAALLAAYAARDRITTQLKQTANPEQRKTLLAELAEARKTISSHLGMGGNMGAGAGAALLGATAAAGGAASNKYIEDNEHKYAALQKRANIFAAGLGHAASGFGKAVNFMAQNPGAAGAVGGAVIGAGMGGPDNRLGGAMSGALLGGGLGYGAGKGLLGTGAQNFATNTQQAVQGFGNKMTQAGTGVVQAAAAPQVVAAGAAAGATQQTFGQMVSQPFKAAFGVAS
jgi:hypothetical protein